MPEAGLFSAAEMVEIAVQLEQNGQGFYLAASLRAANPEAKQLLELLAREEERHERVFRAMQPVETEHRPPAGEPGERSAYIQALLEERLLPSEDLVAKVLPSLGGDAEVLNFALGFEKDTILFYYEMRHVMGGAHREIMDDILTQEKSHVERLRRMCRVCQRP
ncbi:MAG TPA: ferritin family protein [Armatimonadota bacterium]|jgi:rubrerythrin